MSDYVMWGCPGCGAVGTGDFPEAHRTKHCLSPLRRWWFFAHALAYWQWRRVWESVRDGARAFLQTWRDLG